MTSQPLTADQTPTPSEDAKLAYDSLLIVGFGGPEGLEDVIPFLENVLRGRPVPRERMLEVAEHYYHFGGVSPINGQVRALIAALRPELNRREIELPIYWGNRNWHPMLADTLREMAADGRQRALALVLAGYSSYSSCRQYREDIEKARETVGQNAPQAEKIRVFYNHPDFITANADCVLEGLNQLPETERSSTHIAFTAHSIPMSMAGTSNYELQLKETCRLVAEALGIDPTRWKLVYQSRSGRPSDPWLEPDIVDHLKALRQQGVSSVVVQPIGFLSDHMEVLFDLDEEAQQVSQEIGLRMVRADSVGTHPKFISMLGELIQERLLGSTERRAIGQYGPNHDVCPISCCPAPARSGPPPRFESNTQRG